MRQIAMRFVRPALNPDARLQRVVAELQAEGTRYVLDRQEETPADLPSPRLRRAKVTGEKEDCE